MSIIYEIRAVYLDGVNVQSFPLDELKEAELITGKAEPDEYGIYHRELVCGINMLKHDQDFKTLKEAEKNLEKILKEGN